MNIYEKLSQIQQKLAAPKNQYNKFGEYYYRSCEDILEGLKPFLKELNVALTLTDEMVMIGERYYIKATATLFNCEGDDKVQNVAYARETESRPKMDVSQITGSASSYARKYALNGLFCIDDVKDEDAKDNSQKETEKPKQSEVKQEEVEKAKIPEVKVQALISRCETEGVKVDTIKTLYKVSSFADLNEKQFRHISDNWEKLKVM